jgi:geranylgeranyl pyrophosphate synthase
MHKRRGRIVGVRSGSMAMDRLDDEFAIHWDELRADLANRLPELTLSLFRDLPTVQATVIALLIENGKKLRAGLLLAVCEALGGSAARALPSAAVIECVHAASLIHDDLVDGDRTRRDRPATWVVLGSRRAVLLADVMFATALHRSAELGKQEMITVSHAIAMLAVGAYEEQVDSHELETSHASHAMQRARYDRIIRLKTGSLFAAAAELGALAAGARPALRRAASEFGARIGEAYQIADDLHDVLSAPRGESPLQIRYGSQASLLAAFDEPSERSTGADRAGAQLPESFLLDAEHTATAMEKEIGRRIQLAREALAPLPAGPRLAFLHRAPCAIVDPILLAAARTRSGDLAVGSLAR